MSILNGDVNLITRLLVINTVLSCLSVQFQKKNLQEVSINYLCNINHNFCNISLPENLIPHIIWYFPKFTKDNEIY